MTQPALNEDPQTSFEEQELKDPDLLTALNAWAETDDGVAAMKEAAKPHKQAVDDAKEALDTAAAVVSARLNEMEIEIGEDDAFRCGVYRLTETFRAEAKRDFTVPEKRSLKIERDAS